MYSSTDDSSGKASRREIGLPCKKLKLDRVEKKLKSERKAKKLKSERKEKKSNLNPDLQYQGSSEHHNHETGVQKSGSTEKSFLQEQWEENLLCSICHEIFDDCVSLQPCLHSFCAACHDLWMKKSDNCPECRMKVIQVSKNCIVNKLVAAYFVQFPEKMLNDSRSSKSNIEKVNCRNKQVNCKERNEENDVGTSIDNSSPPVTSDCDYSFNSPYYSEGVESLHCSYNSVSVESSHHFNYSYSVEPNHRLYNSDGVDSFQRPYNLDDFNNSESNYSDSVDSFHSPYNLDHVNTSESRYSDSVDSFQRPCNLDDLDTSESHYADSVDSLHPSSETNSLDSFYCPSDCNSVDSLHHPSDSKVIASFHFHSCQSESIDSLHLSSSSDSDNTFHGHDSDSVDFFHRPYNSNSFNSYDSHYSDGFDLKFSGVVDSYHQIHPDSIDSRDGYYSDSS